MSWAIKTQTEGKGDKAKEVRCRHVKFFPGKGKDGNTVFFPLKFLVLKVLVAYKDGPQCMITWSDFCGGGGKFKFTYPSKIGKPVLKDSTGKKLKNRQGFEVPDYMSPDVEIKGESEEFLSMNNFCRFLQAKIGVDCATEVLGAWSERLTQVLAAREQRALDKAAKEAMGEQPKKRRKKAA